MRFTAPGKMMGFEGALDAMKRGARVMRYGWSEKKGARLAIQRPSGSRGTMSPPFTLPYIYIEYPDGGVAPWTPSPTDLLADDWVELVQYTSDSRPTVTVECAEVRGAAADVREQVRVLLDDFCRRLGAAIGTGGA